MPERRVHLVAVLVAVALLWALLALPNQPGVITPVGLRRFPLELPALLLLLVAVPTRAARPLRGLVTGLLVATTLAKLADLGTETAFERPFNPMLDGQLVAAAWNLGSGSLGAPLAVTIVVGLLVGIVGIALATWWATGRVTGASRPSWRWPAALLAVPALLLAGVDATGRFDPPGHARTTEMTAEHLRAAVGARRDLAVFRTQAAGDARVALPPAAMLAGLQGHDVMLIFAESYGRTALDNPRYAPETRRALQDAETEIVAAGLAMRSGWLTAPMVGGQSWLAHSSLLSGLRIDNQGRYRALLESPRRTLLHLAQGAGWETVAVMPAITFAWPEAGYFGYDRVLASADLGYHGQPFDWATMPDQFTLASFERQALDPAPRRPVFAEIALVSSHAPWTPLPVLLPWDVVGDGSVFDAAATAGERAATLWLDEDRVRTQYGRAIDYVVRTIGSFAARRAATGPLIVVLGDHQPVGFVSEEAGGRDVPVHVIGPPALLGLLDGWGWTPGLHPDPDVMPWPMEAFRDRFLDAFAAPMPDLTAGVP